MANCELDGKGSTVPHWLTMDRLAKEQRKSEAARKRGKRARRKGKRGEDELAHVLTAVTGEQWEARRGDKDVRPRDPKSGWARWHVEAKRRKRIGQARWCEQAAGDAALHGRSYWVVIWREDALPGERRPPWYATLPLTDLVELASAVQEGDDDNDGIGDGG